MAALSEDSIWYINPGDDTKDEIIDKLVIGWSRTRLFSDNFADLEKTPLDILDTILKWSRKTNVTKMTDFSQFKYIGFVADSGETIRGEIMRRIDSAKMRNVFLHFENGGVHMDSKRFGWFDVPNERFRLVPKVPPKVPPYAIME